MAKQGSLRRRFFTRLSMPQVHQIAMPSLHDLQPHGASHDRSNQQSSLRWLLSRTRPYWKWHFASIVLLSLASVLSLADPLVIRWLIDTALPAKRTAWLALGVGTIFLSFHGRAVLSSAGSFCTFHANQRAILRLRVELATHLSRLSADYQESTPVGAKVYVIRDAVEELMLLGADIMPTLMRTVLLGVSVLATMFVLNARLTLVILPAIPIFLFTIRRLRGQLQGASELVQGHASKASSRLQEHMSALVQIQLLLRERLQVRKSYREWANVIRSEYQRKKAETRYVIAANSIIAVGIAAILGYGGLQVISGFLTIGSLVAFYAYVTRLFEPLYTAIELNSRLARVRASIRRIRGVLELTPSVRDLPGATVLRLKSRGLGVRVEAASFAYYPGRNLVDGVDLEIPAGARLALVGPSGSGKSTVAKLIARLYDPHSGIILLDGIDVRNIRLHSVRAAVNYLPQHAILFDANLRDNVRLGNPFASWQQLCDAADVAGLTTVIERLPAGWSESLGPGGECLSGGERQRVAIARAILQKPRLLILDESTGQLDSPTERAVLEGLDAALSQTTLIVISHRLSAISWVDQIVVMKDGSISEIGTHTQLYRSGGLYTRMYDFQTAGQTGARA